MAVSIYANLVLVAVIYVMDFNNVEYSVTVQLVVMVPFKTVHSTLSFIVQLVFHAQPQLQLAATISILIVQV